MYPYDEDQFEDDGSNDYLEHPDYYKNPYEHDEWEDDEDFDAEWEDYEDERIYPDDYVPVPEEAASLRWEYRSRSAQRMLLLIARIDFRLQMLGARIRAISSSIRANRRQSIPF